MAKKGTEEKSLETLLSEIEETVEKLSAEELPLETAFSLYEEGVKKSRLCQKLIGDVEQKMQVLTADGELEEFAP